MALVLSGAPWCILGFSGAVRCFWEPPGALWGRLHDEDTDIDTSAETDTGPDTDTGGDAHTGTDAVTETAGDTDTGTDTNTASDVDTNTHRCSCNKGLGYGRELWVQISDFIVMSCISIYVQGCKLKISICGLEAATCLGLRIPIDLHGIYVSTARANRAKKEH